MTPWRQTRPHPSARIPQTFWEQAVALTAVVPPSRVAKQLRVRFTALNKQMGLRAAAPAAGPPGPLGFVAVPPSPAWPQPLTARHIELSRADGTRLCLHNPEASLPLAAQ